MELENILKVMADETRLRVLNLLSKKTMCCMEIQYILEDIKQSNLSRHMAKLSDAGVIVKEKKAQWINYSLNEEMINKYSFIRTILKDELENVEIITKDNKNYEKCVAGDVTCEKLKGVISCD